VEAGVDDFGGVSVTILIVGVYGIELGIGGIIFETGSDLVAPFIPLLAIGGVGGMDFYIVMEVGIVGCL
jgi:hypothetical protein